MSRYFAIREFIRHFARARTVYNIHSPFLYQWAQDVLEDDRHYYAFDELEALRQKLLHVDTEIEVRDYGAGPRGGAVSRRRISEIARTSLITPAKGRWLFRMVQAAGPATILELGTAFGLSALYMKNAARKARLVTLEGNPASVRIARKNFSIFPHTRDIKVLEGHFSANLPKALAGLGSVDFVFMDGHHRQAPTLEYFEVIRPYLHTGSVVVLDDIYWSGDMASAWRELSARPDVRLSVDMYYFGVLFFREENIEKLHLRVLPSAWKPWVRSW